MSVSFHSGIILRPTCLGSVNHSTRRRQEDGTIPPTHKSANPGPCTAPLPLPIPKQTYRNLHEPPEFHSRPADAHGAFTSLSLAAKYGINIRPHVRTHTHAADDPTQPGKGEPLGRQRDITFLDMGTGQAEVIVMHHEMSFRNSKGGKILSEFVSQIWDDVGEEQAHH